MANAWRTRECIKEGWGHISNKHSQMLVKVHQLCARYWKRISLNVYSLFLSAVL